MPTDNRNAFGTAPGFPGSWHDDPIAVGEAPDRLQPVATAGHGYHHTLDERTDPAPITRARRDCDPPEAARVAEEVRRVVPHSHVGGYTAADPTLMRAANTIVASINLAILADKNPPTTAGLAAAIAHGVRNGVTAASCDLAGEIERLRAAMLRAADTLAPDGAPSCFEPKPSLVVAMARALREAARP